MAEKKTSRAEKIVSDAKKKTTATAASGKSKGKTSSKNTDKTKKAEPRSSGSENAIPNTFITAFFSLAFFILFLVISINPDGALLKFVQAVVLGLIGQAGFYFAIPGFLYLFVINTFGRKSAVSMRSFCVISFVFICGCLFHLSMPTALMDQGFAMIPDLYMGGIEGTTGGILCGGAAMLLRWSCGKPISFLLLGFFAVLTLLGSMQITIPSIVRAIVNRPREDWDDEEDDYIEPAAIVVNHIANKQIQQKRQRREKLQQERSRMAEATSAEAKDQEIVTPVKKAVPVAKAEVQQPVMKHPQKDMPIAAVPTESEDKVKQVPGKGSAFMSRIDTEIGAPLPGTAGYVREDIPNVFEEPVVEISGYELSDVEMIPEKMPELKPVSTVPKKAASPKLPEKGKEEAKTTKLKPKDTAESAIQVAAEIQQNQSIAKAEYCFPPIDLLKTPARGGGDGTEEMRENSRRLNETLASFKIDAHIINVTRGPSVTRYEVELDKGVRLNKLTGCADDIALSLGASGVRIAAVPGKISVVGIEVPNRVVTTVSLREVIDSPEFNRSKSKSSFAVGKDIGGSCIIGNIAKMPHLLIAGTTGSGKSVCMNSIIISLLYKAGPEDVKLIMVDPKMVA